MKRKNIIIAISIILISIFLLQAIVPIITTIKTRAINEKNLVSNLEIKEETSLETNLETIKFGSYSNEDKETEVNSVELVKESSMLLENKENISEAYLEWTELSEEEKQETVEPRKEYIDISEFETNNQYVTSAASIPEEYNLREILSEIKIESQGSAGNCYAFAGLNSIETNIAIKTGTIYDFSEMHVEYMTSNLLGGNRTLNAGGNFQTVVEYSKDLQGPVLESEIANRSYSEEEYSLLKSAKPVIILTDTIEFPTINKRYGYTEEELTEFRESVKSHIMENGSVYASIYFSESSKYYNSSTKGYCCLDTSIMTNHAVSIIGWDDNYSKDNFQEANRPTNDGAWIALNSHGSSFGDNGVFYISYEDNWVEYNMSGIISTTDFEDTFGPKIELKDYADENNVISSTVEVYDRGGSGVDTANLRYLWSQSEYEPSLEDFIDTFTNGNTLTKEYEDGEKWYLWILAYDNSGNYSINEAGVVTIKFNDKTLYGQIKGVGYYGVEDYIYGYNDETYEVQILKSELDKITELSIGTLWTSGPSGNSLGGGHDVSFEDLSGLEKFENLQTLSFNAKETIQNIEVLQQLDKLSSLTIGYGLDNIKFVENLNSLEKLVIRKTSNLRDVNIDFPESLEELKIYECNNLVDANANYPQNLKYLMIRNCANLTNVSNIDFPNKIEEIMLNGNSIKDISQVDWPSSLKYLCLTENDLETVNGSNWSNNLEILDLSFNTIQDINNINLPSGLIELYIGDNKISDISTLGNLTNLQTFSAGSNYIEDISVVEKMTNLNAVYFGSTVWWCYYFYNHSGPYGNILGYSRDHGNSIKSVDIKWPQNISDLKLDHNKIETLENIAFPSGIKTLELSYNQISKVSLEMDNLRFVYLDNNNIKDISGINVPNTKTDRTLDLSNNEIETIDNANWKEGRIDTLILSNNKILSIDNAVWPQNLDSLALNNNNINSISNINFGTKLRYLILNNNNITDIKNIDWPETLKAIEAANNNITDLSWIESATNLIGVAVNENNIYDIESLSLLIKLQELHLDNNYIEDITPIENLSNLTKLYIKDQEIIKIVNSDVQSIEVPKIIQSSMDTDSKVYTENSTILIKCSIEEGNIVFETKNIGYIYIAIDGGNADGTTILITNTEVEHIDELIYKVETKEELISLREIINNSNSNLSNMIVKLMNDIDLGGYYNEETGSWKGEKWIPIGNSENPFSCIFDGNGNKITGVYIDSELDYQGFIGNNEGTIKNLGIESGSITTTGKYVGGIVGQNCGTATIENCYNKANITGNYYVGGIAGYNNNSYSGGVIISKCHNAGSITAQSSYAAGILGSSWINGVIEQCYNSGSVKSDMYSAGIIGRMYGSEEYPTKVINCYNTGNISSESGRHGGIVAQMAFGKNDIVSNCYNLGAIENNGTYIGEIIGSSSQGTLIKNCYYQNVSDIGAIQKKDDDENNVYGLDNRSMQKMSFVNLLNEENEEIIWKIGDSNYHYPMLVWQEYTGEVLPEKTLESIEITTKPYQKNYKNGENFNPTGMVITGTYDDKSTAIITDYTVIGGDNLNCLVNKVIIQSNENLEINTEVQIQVAHDIVDATCIKATECKVEGCNYTEGEPLDHSFTNYVSNSDATCEANGTETAKCDRCEETHTRTDTESAQGHNYEAQIISPTCTTQGHTTHTCSRCSDSYADTYTDALDHSFTNYVSNNDATCTEDGTETAKCDRCEETHTRTKVGSALGHNYESIVTAPTCTEKGYTTHTCTRCEKTYTDTYTEIISHNYENGTCTSCGAKELKFQITTEKYNIQNSYITKIQAQTTVKMLKENVETNATELNVYNKNKELQTDTSKLATGMIIEFKFNNKTYIYTLVVTGDINGDGEVKFSDMTILNRYRLKKRTLEEAYLLAADVTEDGKADFKDLVKINRYRLNKITTL